MNLRRRLRLPWPFVFATKRISLQIALTVTGRDEHDSIFVDQVLTENVSKDGGCLLFRRDLRRMQSFRIEARRGALSRPGPMAHVLREEGHSRRRLSTGSRFEK